MNFPSILKKISLCGNLSEVNCSLRVCLRMMNVLRLENASCDMRISVTGNLFSLDSRGTYMDKSNTRNQIEENYSQSIEDAILMATGMINIL